MSSAPTATATVTKSATAFAAAAALASSAAAVAAATAKRPLPPRSPIAARTPSSRSALPPTPTSSAHSSTLAAILRVLMGGIFSRLMGLVLPWLPVAVVGQLAPGRAAAAASSVPLRSPRMGPPSRVPSAGSSARSSPPGSPGSPGSGTPKNGLRARRTGSGAASKTPTPGTVARALGGGVGRTTSSSPSVTASLGRVPRHPALRKKTLVLDLDETLIHSTSRGLRRCDHLIEVTIDHHKCLYYVYKRPHVDFFLRKVAEWYKVVIYTASLQEYADPVIDFLDGHRGLIAKRYFRQSCIQHGGTYLKDLAVVEPDLSQVCLLDNSPISYAINQANGIPIEGWVSDQQDEALLELLPFLDALRFAEDVRSVLGLRLYSP
ncbi:Nuclear envelope morphology protein 1 [Blastocladiella emersonii ATCC 22665]|nr:Nuclear envelope morphology protein 1 [Blastocladiella emersonii ATCC 22665]